MNSHFEKYSQLSRLAEVFHKLGKIEEMKKFKEAADKEYNQYLEESKQEEEKRQYIETKNFGIVNSIIENSLPSIFKGKEGRKIAKEYISLIKEDKNLSSQYQLYNTLLEKKNVHSMDDEKTLDFVKEVVDICLESINQKELKKSNEKLVSFLQSHNINESVDVTDILPVCEAIEFVITNKKKISNLVKYNENINIIKEHLMNKEDENFNDIVNEEEDVVVKEFNEKHGTSFVKEQREMVNDLLSEDKKQGVFDKCKNNCLESINNLLSIAPSQDLKETLLNYKEKLLNKQYNENTVVEDVANLLELNDLLNSPEEDGEK